MKVVAKCTVELKITVDGCWDDSCSIGQVRKQVKDETRELLTKVLRDVGNVCAFELKSVSTTLEAS